MLKDSKLCQLEQIKEKQCRKQETKDFNDAWAEIQTRDYLQKTERENYLKNYRRHEGLSVQESLKQQMMDRTERGLEVHKEITEERKQFAQMWKEDFEKKQEEIRSEQSKRKSIRSDILKQMTSNHQLKKSQQMHELKVEQRINDRIRNELERHEMAQKSDRELFQRQVFHYLEHLMKTRHENELTEREKQKLVDDIRMKITEDDWKICCEQKQKRLLINQSARCGQIDQIRQQEKIMTAEIAREKHENEIFNEREMLERQRIKEEQWQTRLQRYRYGQELLEQQKTEELRNLAQKQKLDEELLKIAQEHERCEKMGSEFVNSYQDILPLHPNMLIIRRGKLF